MVTLRDFVRSVQIENFATNFAQRLVLDKRQKTSAYAQRNPPRWLFFALIDKLRSNQISEVEQTRVDSERFFSRGV